MNRSDNPACDRVEMIRDYAFDELAPPERKSVAQHLTTCSDCAAELDRLRLTTAALRVLPDVEVPRRIAFVSDKVFEQGWFGGLWNPARLGVAAACLLSVGLSFAAYRRPPVVRTVVQTASLSQADINAAVAGAVDKSVALAVASAHAEDMRMTKAALDAVDNKYAQKQLALMIAMQDNLDRDNKRLKLARLESMGPQQ